MYKLTFGHRSFYARTLEEIFTIIGEQDGAYNLEWIKDEA
jgi:hypothetical protein